MDDVVSRGGSERVEKPDSDAVAALAALYGAERADNQNSLAQALVLVGMLIAYSVGVGAIIATSPETLTEGHAPYLTLFLPVPVWAAVGYHTIINALVFAHNQSIEAIEAELRNVHGAGEWVGGLAGRMVSDARLLKKERRPLWFATWMGYGLTALIVLAFTFVSALLPLREGVAWWACLIATLVYAALVLITAFSWKLIFSIDATKVQAWVGSFQEVELKKRERERRQEGGSIA